MALSYSVLLNESDATASDPQSFSSITTVQGSLLVVLHHVVKVSPTTVSSMSSDAFATDDSSDLNAGWAWDSTSTDIFSTVWTARGTGGTGTISVDYAATPSEVGMLVIEVTGQGNVDLGDYGSSSGTTSTALASLVAPPASGSECLHIAQWADAADDATAGSGWDEMLDGAMGSSRIYAQKHTTGSQSGQVSGIANQKTVSFILELIDRQGIGWGIPI